LYLLIRWQKCTSNAKIHQVILEALSKQMRFIDAHHHLWDLSCCRYPWLEARGVQRFFGDPTPIQKDYLLEDFLSESTRYRPEKSVHVQVGVAEGDEVRESQWISELGSKPEAIVCFVDLSATAMEQTLAKQAQVPRVRGVRQILGRHPVEDRHHGSDSLIDDAGFAHGLRRLESSGLSFDLQLIPPQHQRVASLLERYADLPVAVCHAGSPWDQSPEGLKAWEAGLMALAARPQTVLKISGLGMFNRNWKIEDLEPIVYRSIDIFGPERVMIGSNFPVDKLYHSYERWWQAIETLLTRFNTQERHAMLVGTAERFYRLGAMAI
jgi:predicted TIM-barrel fold metal-dependent hydrolase